MARPTKYCETTAAKIAEALKLGNTRKTAYTIGGICADTFAAWMLKFPAFSASVKKAEEEAVARNVGLIQSAAIKQWQAAAWWLERKRPDDWKPRSGVEIDMTKLTDEEFEELDRIADKAAITGAKNG